MPNNCFGGRKTELTEYLVLLGSFEKLLEIFVHKFKVKSKLKMKPVHIVVYFLLVTFSWSTDAEQMEAWVQPGLGVLPNDSRWEEERERGVEVVCKGENIWIDHSL